MAMPAILSLAHLTQLSTHPIELIELAAGAGFDAVGLRLWPPLPGDVVAPVLEEPKTRRAIRQRLRQTGIELLDIEAFWLRPDSDLDAFLRAYEVGAELGARHVLIVGHDPHRARLTESLGKTCEEAVACGLSPMLEFIPYTAVRSLAEAHELLAAAGAADAGLLVDALHLARSGGSPDDLALYPPDLFRYVHLCDAPSRPPMDTDALRREARGARLYPGEGELWLSAFLRAFPRDVPVALEAPTIRHGELSTIDRLRLAAKLSRSVIERAWSDEPAP
ncbi:AP endonuclease [Mesorhizobium sp. L-8-10]|nr:AP endonuclease [Mesorhizobium sp. L-8-10]